MMVPQVYRRRAVLGVGMAGVVSHAAGTRAGEMLIRRLGDAEIDWHRGIVQARGGAAADIRLPGPQVARAAAERSARARATAFLRTAIPLFDMGAGKTVSGKTLDIVLADLRTMRIEYESNGGVTVVLGATFATLASHPSASDKDDHDHEGGTEGKLALCISIARTALVFRPTLSIEGHPVTPTYATYRIGAAPALSLTAKRDRAGRLVVEGKVPGGFVGRSVIIYAGAVD